VRRGEEVLFFIFLLVLFSLFSHFFVSFTERNRVLFRDFVTGIVVFCSTIL
jgi:hypothetical protein